MEKNFFVYILASAPRGTLYVGVTSDLQTRIAEHKAKIQEGFTKRYDVDRLVWFEPHGAAESAIAREKRLKHWNRDWKIGLVEKTNPHWTDLYESLFA